MKNWLKNFGIAILFAFITVSIIVWLAYTIFVLKNDPQLSNAYVAVGTLILALVTSLLVGLTWLTIRKADQREKHDRKERLLNEIIGWAEEINNASLTPDISLISKVVELMKGERDVDVNIYIELLEKEREENVLMRYGNSLTKAISIETITSEGFKKQLLQDVKEVINTLAKFMCIKQLKLFGVMPTKKVFPETVIKEMEKEINEGKNLLANYGMNTPRNWLSQFIAYWSKQIQSKLISLNNYSSVSPFLFILCPCVYPIYA